MQKHGAKATVGDEIHDRIHTAVYIRNNGRPIVYLNAVCNNPVLNQVRDDPDRRPTGEEQQRDYSASGRYAKGASLTSCSLFLLERR